LADRNQVVDAEREVGSQNVGPRVPFERRVLAPATLIETTR
jgi:hypothetical protein